MKVWGGLFVLGFNKNVSLCYKYEVVGPEKKELRNRNWRKLSFHKPVNSLRVQLIIYNEKYVCGWIWTLKR